MKVGRERPIKMSLIHKPSKAFFQQFDVEVYEQAHSLMRQLYIAYNLGFVDRQKSHRSP
jgi:hypothetical protein